MENYRLILAHMTDRAAGVGVQGVAAPRNCNCNRFAARRHRVLWGIISGYAIVVLNVRHNPGIVSL